MPGSNSRAHGIVRGRDRERMTLPGIKFFIMTLVLAACMLAAAPARAQKIDSKKESEKHFALGIYFYKQGDFHEALAEFESAYSLKPHFTFRYNIGLCWKKIGDPAMALTEFSLYFIEGGEKTDKKIEKALQKISMELIKKVAIVEIQGMPDGAIVYVDGSKNAMGSMGFEFYANPGKHTIEVIADSMVLVSRTIDAIAGKNVTISLQKEDYIALMEQADGEELPVAEHPEGGKKKGKSALTQMLWASAALAAGCLIAGGVTGGLALSEKSAMIDAEDLYEERLGMGSDEEMQSILDDADAHYDRAKNLGNSSTATFAAGGVLAAVSLALLIVKLTKKGKSEEKNVRISIAPLSKNQPAAMMLEWKF